MSLTGSKFSVQMMLMRVGTPMFLRIVGVWLVVFRGSSLLFCILGMPIDLSPDLHCRTDKVNVTFDVVGQAIIRR